MFFPKTRFTDKTDKELIHSFRKSQDDRYLSELFGRYAYLVLFMCNKYFKDPEESQDATMEVLERMAKYLMTHDVEDFKSWMYRVTKNLCIDKIRSNKELNMIFVDIMEEDLEPIMHFSEIDRLINEDDDQTLKKKKLLVEALETLESDQRQCFTLFYIEQKSYREIMAMRQWDKNQVRSHLQNAKRKIKIYIDQKGDHAKTFYT